MQKLLFSFIFHSYSDTFPLTQDAFGFESYWATIPKYDEISMPICRFRTQAQLTGFLAFPNLVEHIGTGQRKLIDWNKTKVFRFRWYWVEEKKLRGTRLRISTFFNTIKK